MVLFWGWTRNDTSYRRLIETAPGRFHIHTLSFQNFMKSSWVNQLSDNVTKYLDEKNLGKVDLVGHSLGGAFALEYAYYHPERVRHLYLLDSSGILDKRSLTSLLVDFFSSQSIRERKKMVENLRAVYRILRWPIVYWKLAYYVRHIDLEEEAQQIKTPTTIIWGGKDKLNPLWQGEKLQELIKNSRLIILDSMNHDWPLYKPELFWDNING
ncbi:MAG: alpha/beta hydrolase [Candidatus Levyibacteriota bacterium]